MTAPFTIENDRPIPKGGQVPLLKHACMAWLQRNRAMNGRILGDSYNIADDTKAAVSNVTRALWDLQKQGLVTFRERKNAGTNGHGSQTVLNHFELTPKGLDWTPDKAVLDDLTSVPTNTLDDLNPAFLNEAEDVADEMKAESREKAIALARDALSQMPPAVALERVLRHAGRPMHIIRELNPLLGYYAQSTAIYSLVRKNPEAFHIKDARVHLDAPEGWEPAYDTSINYGRTRKEPSAALMAEARASVALDGETQVVETVKPERVARTHPLDDPDFRALVAIDLANGYPEIKALMERESKRAKVAEAVAALEAAGLEDDALVVLGRIPDDTPLEREVIALVKELRNG